MTLLSPGIEIKEKDLSAYISRAATGRAATVGKFQWGPCFDITQVTDESDVVNTFGLPDDYTAASFFSVTNFLKYANDCRVVRICDNRKVERDEFGVITPESGTTRNASAEYQIEIKPSTAIPGYGYDVGDQVHLCYESVPWTRNASDNYATVNFGSHLSGSNGPVIGILRTSDFATIPLSDSTPITGVFVETSVDHGKFTIPCNVTSELAGTITLYWPADYIATVTTLNGTNGITDLQEIQATKNMIVTGSRFCDTSAANFIIAIPTDSGIIDIGVTHVIINDGDILRWVADAGAESSSPEDGTRYFRVNKVAGFAADDLDTKLAIQAAITAGELVEDVLATIDINAGLTSNCFFPNDAAAADAILAEKPYMELINAPSIYARYPGAYGDDIQVDIINHIDFTSKYQKYIPIVIPEQWLAPGQAEINRNIFGVNIPENDNQWAMIVYYKGDPVETFLVSTRPGDKDIYGRTIYISDMFAAGASKYIMAACGDEGYWPSNSMRVTIHGGVDNAATASDWCEGWDLLSDPDTLYVNLLFAGGACNESEEDSITIQKYISENVAEIRRDCLAFLSPSISTTTRVSAYQAVENAVNYRSNETNPALNLNTSFAECDSGQHKFQFDKYNDKKRWIANNADIAGLCAFTDRVAAPWNSPAGLNRGNIKGIIKLAYDAKKSLRDTLYEAQLNPIVFFPSEGYCLFGDKTLQSKPSAFDRINVRRLFNLLEKAIGDASKYKLFENNTAFTRRSFVTQVSSYLDTIKAQGGVIEYYVWCDERNNTPAVIDRNEFVGTIFIKPPRSINYITLNFVATATGANFEELIASQF